MGRLGCIIRKELASYFNSAIAYVVMGVFVLLSGLLFFGGIFFEQNQAELRGLFTGVWTSLLAVIMGPAISMRLLSEEKNNETMEILLTMPVSTASVVWGKYIAAVLTFGCALLVMLSFSVVVFMLGPIDIGPTVTGFLGLYLSIACYIAIGLAASAFTKNQIVAFLVGIVVCSFLWMLGKFQSIFPDKLRSIVGFLAMDTHLNSLARGLLDIGDLFYFVFIIVGGVLLAQVKLEQERGR